MGEARQTGRFEHSQQVGLRQAISLAEGLNRKAAPEHAVIMRQDQVSGKLMEIQVDLNAVLRGWAQDQLLLQDDVLIIPKRRSQTER